MPSGAKKRKAAKKKVKKGEAHDSNDQHHHGNSSSIHSHGSNDPKSLDERGSDSGELEREEEEKGEAGRKEEIADQQDGDIAKGEGLKEDIVRVEMEAKPPENGSGSADLNAVSIATPIVVLTSETSVPGDGSVEDKEVTVVEEEKSIIAESGEMKGQDAGSALVGVHGDDIPEAAVAYVSEKAVGVGGASIEEFQKSVEGISDDELVKQVITLAQEVSPVVESLVISDVVGLELIKNVDSLLQLSDDKKFSSTAGDRQIEKIESQVISADEDKSLDASIVNTNRGVGADKALESGNQPEEKVVASASTTTQVVDNVKNKETRIQSHGDGTELDTRKESEEQPLIGSNPQPVQRTSWMGCCGLFEVFTGANR